MQFADNSGISVKYMLISLLHYASNDHSYLAYKYTTLATRQMDVVVRTALTAAMVVPSTMFNLLASTPHFGPHSWKWPT